MLRLLCILSAVVFLASVALWARSRWWAYDLAWVWLDANHRLFLNSHQGVLGCYISSDSTHSWDRAQESRCAWWSLGTRDEVVWDEPVFDDHGGFGGFSLGTATTTYDGVQIQTGLAAPYWALSTLLACWPAAGVIRRCRRRGCRQTGLCTRCGYDLRASRGRCPECGTPMPSSSPAPQSLKKLLDHP